VETEKRREKKTPSRHVYSSSSQSFQTNLESLVPLCVFAFELMQIQPVSDVVRRRRKRERREKKSIKYKRDYVTNG
jgi:amino acid permease